MFYRVISSLSQVGYGRLSKLRKRVWNVLGQELSVEKLFRTDGSCIWMVRNLLFDLHFVL